MKKRDELPLSLVIFLCLGILGSGYFVLISLVGLLYGQFDIKDVTSYFSLLIYINLIRKNAWAYFPAILLESIEVIVVILVSIQYFAFYSDLQKLLPLLMLLYEGVFLFVLIKNKKYFVLK